MAALNAIRVRNLRSLEDTGFISLKRFTVLVGKNGAGKSTFARLFPLLRQSVEESKRTPILFYGRLVDFGTISDALGDSVSNDSIEFGFRVSFTYESRERFFHEDKDEIEEKEFEAELYLEVKRREDQETTALARITLRLAEVECEVKFSSDSVLSIQVGNYSWIPPPNERQRITYRSLLPEIDFIRERQVVVDGQERTLIGN